MRRLNQISITRRSLAQKANCNPDFKNVYSSIQDDQIPSPQRYFNSVSPVQRPETRKGNFNSTIANWKQGQNRQEEFPSMRSNECFQNNGIRILVTRGGSRRKPMVDDCKDVNLQNYGFNSGSKYCTTIGFGMEGSQKGDNCLFNRDSIKEKESFNNLRIFLGMTQKEGGLPCKSPGRFIKLPPLVRKEFCIDKTKAIRLLKRT